MRRLFKSSNFWNALIASVVMFLTIIFIHSDVEKDIILYEFILFGGRTAVSGFSDILKSKNNVTFNPETGKDERI